MYNSNYGYNSYYPQQKFIGVPQQPIQQPLEQPSFMQNKPIIGVKQVDSIEVVKASEIPLDFNVNYFSLADGSAIFTKQYQQDGSCRIMTYKPIFNEEKTKTQYVTYDEIDNLKNQIKELKEKIEELRENKKSKKKDDDKNE